MKSVAGNLTSCRRRDWCPTAESGGRDPLAGPAGLSGRGMVAGTRPPATGRTVHQALPARHPSHSPSQGHIALERLACVVPSVQRAYANAPTAGGSGTVAGGTVAHRHSIRSLPCSSISSKESIPPLPKAEPCSACSPSWPSCNESSSSPTPATASPQPEHEVVSVAADPNSHQRKHFTRNSSTTPETAPFNRSPIYYEPPGPPSTAT